MADDSMPPRGSLKRKKAHMGVALFRAAAAANQDCNWNSASDDSEGGSVEVTGPPRASPMTTVTGVPDGFGQGSNAARTLVAEGTGGTVLFGTISLGVNR
jgi:hypothetical protein